MQISKGGIWRILWSVFNSHPQPPSATISNVPHILPGNVKFRIWNNTSIFRLICWDLGTVLCCRRTCSIARLERNSCLDWPDGNEELTYARIVDRDAWDRRLARSAIYHCYLRRSNTEYDSIHAKFESDDVYFRPLEFSSWLIPRGSWIRWGNLLACRQWQVKQIPIDVRKVDRIDAVNYNWEYSPCTILYLSPIPLHPVSTLFGKWISRSKMEHWLPRERYNPNSSDGKGNTINSRQFSTDTISYFAGNSSVMDRYKHLKKQFPIGLISRLESVPRWEQGSKKEDFLQTIPAVISRATGWRWQRGHSLLLCWDGYILSVSSNFEEFDQDDRGLFIARYGVRELKTRIFPRRFWCRT
jgi:hypothetical protein